MPLQWYRNLDRDRRRGFWSSAAGFSLDAMDVQLYAFLMPTLLALWGLSHAQAGLLASAALAASAVGGWLAGLLADRLGRVRVLGLTILWLAVATGLCGLAQTFDQLLAARALQGLGFGGEWAAGALFIAEIAPPAARNRMLGAVQSAWAVGWGLAAATATLALACFPADVGWRLTFAVGLAPALVIFRMRRRLAEPAPPHPRQPAAPWSAIFTAEHLGSTLRGSLLAAGMHGGYWAIATWWPNILRGERGLSPAAASGYFAAIIVGSLFGYWAAAWLGDAAGRRPALATFAAGALASVLVCTRWPVSNAALLVLSFPLGFFALGLFAAIGPVLSEIYPTAVRGSGLGFCYNLGRGVAAVGPALVGVSGARTGLAHAVGAYAGSAYGLVLLATALLPETRGRELDIPPAQPLEQLRAARSEAQVR